ncbi:MAG: PAS domain-containing sensor histidine kinase [Myxococcaceae bacterium]
MDLRPVDITRLSRLVLDALPVEVFIVDPADGQVLDVNEAACRTLGYSRQELLSFKASDIETVVPVHGAAQWAAHVEEIRRSGRHLILEGRHRRKDGSELPVVLSLDLVTIDEREVLMGAAIDVSESVQLRTQLANVESRAQAIVSAMPDLCFLVSRDGTYLDAFVRSDDMLAMPRSAFVGKKIAEVMSPDIAGKTCEGIERVLATGELFTFNYELPVDGQPHYWEARLVRRTPDEVLILCRDVTEVRLAEARLVESARLATLGELAASIAHEIKNPLASLLLTAASARKQLAEQQPSRERLAGQCERVEGTAKRIARIIRALGVFGRKPDSDPFVPVPARTLADDTLALCEQAFSSREVRLDLAIATDLIVECRPGQVVQVLLNLLTNSLDAVQSQPERWCRLEVRDEPGQVSFLVTDSGPGVPPEVHGRLMEPFFTTKELGKGTGLGLSISRRIAEEHGGTLSLETASLNTCFRLSLPKARPRVG